ncbi:MAG TPA: alpha/beta family hydrolase [Casimicrobiaceae bacterium]|nr:alpha/beta family hydrolase [Casimicrobiaceae bacterium]
MDTQTLDVAVGADVVTVRYEAATMATGAPLFVFAHGAGGHMADRGMNALAARFRDCGLDVARFDFPYRARGSRRPDPMPRLVECIDAVATKVAAEVATRLVIGGRSMGGRAASMLAANGFACDRLLLLAYPLHPAGEPAKLRDAHLSRIAVPVLCFNGTRDPLCRRDLMDAVVTGLGANFRMHWLEEADHSFHVTKASGRTDASVLDEISTVTRAWLAE